MKNTINLALATSNCPAFLTGLQNAMAADATINRAQQIMTGNIEQQCRDAASSAIGQNGPNDLYGNNKPHGHRSPF